MIQIYIIYNNIMIKYSIHAQHTKLITLITTIDHSLIVIVISTALYNVND